MATMQDFMPLNTEEESNLAVKRKASKARKRKQKAKIALSGPRPLENKSSVVYVGRIPHGFYEEQMRGFFGQFGTIKRLRISRNKKTGKSKHFAFIEFESPEVAEIVADSMNNYLLYEHLLQVKLVPLERVHHRMWVGSGRVYKPPNFKWLASINENREREPDEQRHILKAVLRRESKRRKRIKDAGIDFEYPDLRATLPARPKKIKFSTTDDGE
ncbi:hypothetical protein GOP47_0013595 [Adiantum capillus-veneris]|uniref:RRM domain-containing protein n=1 Tax=Adiantum capillus-veneris TaxID=13818 RepID=A0A9D4UNU1_ADICA|nr:hypothetical protein GOP47_0013595 [Adiantum capillus-veneris]